MAFTHHQATHVTHHGLAECPLWRAQDALNRDPFPQNLQNSVGNYQTSSCLYCAEGQVHTGIWGFPQETRSCRGSRARNALKALEPGLQQRVGYSHVQSGPGREWQKQGHESRELHGHTQEQAIESFGFISMRTHEK